MQGNPNIIKCMHSIPSRIVVMEPVILTTVGNAGCGQLHTQHHQPDCDHGQKAQARDSCQAAASVAALGGHQL